MGGTGSGRKPLLADRKLEDLLDTAHTVLTRWFLNPEVPDDRKIPVAAMLVAKRIPSRVEAPEGLGGNISNIQVLLVTQNGSTNGIHGEAARAGSEGNTIEAQASAMLTQQG